MNDTKDRRLVWALSLVFLVGLTGMALSVIGYDRSGLAIETLAVFLGVCGAALTVVEVFRSPVMREQRTIAKRPEATNLASRAGRVRR